MLSSCLSLFVLLLAFILAAGEAQYNRYQNPYQPPPQPYLCPPGYQNVYGRCERLYDPYPSRSPYDNLREPSETPPVSCPLGFKLARGVCSKMTEREQELDRQRPLEPCPPGQRRSRLVCRPYIYA